MTRWRRRGSCARTWGLAAALNALPAHVGAQQCFAVGGDWRRSVDPTVEKITELRL